MKNSGVIGLITLFVIGYALLAIGTAAAIIGLGIGLTFLIRWIVKTVKDNKLRKKNKRLFYEYLAYKYNLSRNIEEKKIDEQLKKAITQILAIQNLNSNLIRAFSKFKSNCKQAVNFASIWYNKDLLQGVSCDSSSLSRHTLSFEERGFMDTADSVAPPFLLKSKGCRLFFYPNFVIAEINCDYKILEYEYISVTNDDSIYVTPPSKLL